MNLTSLLRNHPGLAEMIGAAREHLVSCHDCGYHFPLGQLYDAGGLRLCATCFDVRLDAAWQEWLERLAKEGREGAA